MQIREYLVPEFQTLAHKNLLVLGSNREETLIGHIVDILDGNQFILQFIEIIDQCPMTCRSEQKLTILVTERPVLQIHGNSVRGLVLESERDIELDPVFLLISCLHLFQSLLEQRLELRRYREDDIG